LLYQIFDIAENTLSAQKAIKFMALKLDQRQLGKKTRGESMGQGFGTGGQD